MATAAVKMKMPTEDRVILEKLDAVLRSEEVGARIQPIVERVRAQLPLSSGSCRTTARLMAWEPIPLSIYGNALPAVIRSSWVFILRAGANTGAERHPNSHQRMMSFEGSGDMQVEDAQKSEVRRQSSEAGSQKAAAVSGQRLAVRIRWQSNVLVSNPNAPLGRRWISIPQNVWHQAVVSNEADWVVVSFHTVPAEELIEERPIDDGVSETRQMRYLG
jgi:hypothetical protein